MRDGSKGAMVEEVSSIEQKRDGNRRNKKRNLKSGDTQKERRTREGSNVGAC